MKKNYFLLFIAVSLFMTANAQFDGEKAIFVVASLPGTDAELAIVQRLEDMGLEVVPFAQDQVSDADMDDANILLVSAEVNSGTAFESMPGLATYDIPVINWEPALYDELGFTDVSVASVEEPEGMIKIVDSDHPLAAELWDGNIAIATGTKTISVCKPKGEVNIVAVSTTDDSLATIFGYEEGAAMHTGNAPARRVGTFLLNNVADAMTDEGWALFDASVQWAMGLLPITAVNDNRSQNTEVSVYPNPTSGNFELSFVSDYPQLVEINISNVVGQKVLSTTYLANNGMNNLKLNASELKNGLYFYSVSINNSTASGKILITE